MRRIFRDQDPWEILTPQKLLQDFRLRGMLVYDCEDAEVTQGQFDEIIACWKNGEVLATRGLGHNHILKDKAVIKAVVTYLS